MAANSRTARRRRLGEPLRRGEITLEIATTWLYAIESKAWTIVEISNKTKLGISTLYKWIARARAERGRLREWQVKLLDGGANVFKLEGCSQHRGVSMREFVGPNTLCLGCNQANFDPRMEPMRRPEIPTKAKFVPRIKASKPKE